MHALNHVKVDQGSVAIHWFGQSSYAIKDSQGTIVLVDPYFPRERSLDRYVHAVAPVDESTLKTDYVLLTHHHRDHTCLETIGRIHAAWPDARYIGPNESIEAIIGNGVSANVTETVTAGDQTSFGNFDVHVVYAKPPEGDPERGIDPPDVEHLGFVVSVDGVRVYFTGDPINTFAQRDDLVNAVKELEPHIGMLTTHPDEGEFPFFEGSAEMARKIGLKTAVPAHYECFVKRNYDPVAWAAHFGEGDPEPLIIPYNGMVIYKP